MHHFNLIRRSLTSTSKFVIKTIIDGQVWYFFDFSKSDDTIVWTGRLSRAIMFESEKEVEDFKTNFFKGRNCEIVRI